MGGVSVGADATDIGRVLITIHSTDGRTRSAKLTSQGAFELAARLVDAATEADPSLSAVLLAKALNGGVE